mmetsp:Transcript_32267/g.39057  ORF Transcript_32267/g.39057 Transcript_32267/m.39057 type:complete len:111 (-) Transcript_32267:62-394(-)
MKKSKSSVQVSASPQPQDPPLLYKAVMWAAAQTVVRRLVAWASARDLGLIIICLLTMLSLGRLLLIAAPSPGPEGADVGLALGMRLGLGRGVNSPDAPVVLGGVVGGGPC